MTEHESTLGDDLPDDALEKGVEIAYGGAPRAGESALDALERLTGVRSRIHLPDAGAEEGPLVRIPPTSDPESIEEDDRYQVLGEIARGGVGVVFRSRDKDLGRDVALKVLRKDLAESPEVVQRFVEEAQIEGQLQHPGVVPVYGLGLQKDGRPYFAMKLVKGETLAALIRAGREASTLLPVFERICQTVAYAHARRVVHRDLKPSNVLVGAYGEVQLVDWGFAKVLSRGGAADEGGAESPLPDFSIIETVRTKDAGSTSRVGSVMGTPPYMPPEQARGEIDKLDERADVFALGAILCEILTGKPPYVGSGRETVVQAAKADLDGAHARLDASAADAQLVDLAKQCLTPARQARPEHAGEVADAVSAYLAGLEDRKRQAELDAAASRRTRKLTVALAATILVAALGGGAAFYAADRSEQIRLGRAASAVNAAMRDASEAVGRARAADVGDLEPWRAAAAAAEDAHALAARLDATAEVRQSTTRLRRKTSKLLKRATATAVRAKADRALAESLREVRWRWGSPFTSEDAEASHLRVLGEAGLDPHTTEPAEVVEAIEASTIAEVLLEALDRWLMLRIEVGGDPSRIREVLDLADPDPLRTRIRELVGATDEQGLRRVGDEADLESLSEATLALLGDALGQQEAIDAAVEIWSALHERSPHRADWLYRLAHWKGQVEPYPAQAVLGLLTRVVATVPTSAVARHRLGVALTRNGAPMAALDEFRKASRLDPDGVSMRDERASFLARMGRGYASAGRHMEAVEVLRELTTLTPNAGAAWVSLARSEESVQNIAGALEAARRGAELLPEDAHAQLTLADALIGTLQWDEALHFIELALGLAAGETSPGFNAKVAVNRRAQVLARTGRLTDAVEVLDEAIGASEQPFSDQLYVLGFIYLRLGQTEQAVEVLDRLLEIYPAGVNYRLTRVRALLRMENMERLREEVAVAISMVRTGTQSHQARFRSIAPGWIARFLAHTRNVDEARAWYARALPEANAASRASFLTWLGRSRMNVFSDPEAALACADEALRVRDNHPDALKLRHTAFNVLGRDEESLRAAEQLGRLFPRRPQILRLVAIALGNVGRNEEALAYLRQLKDDVGWSVEDVQRMERLVALKAHLPAILAGEYEPADRDDAFLCAVVCADEGYPLAAARLTAASIEERGPWSKDPLIDIRRRQTARRFAAEQTLRAAAGDGRDAGSLSVAERQRLLPDARVHLETFLDEMEAEDRFFDSWHEDERAFTLTRLQHHPFYEIVRGAEALAELPPEERAAWEALWTRVEELRKRWR